MFGSCRSFLNNGFVDVTNPNTGVIVRIMNKNPDGIDTWSGDASTLMLLYPDAAAALGVDEGLDVAVIASQIDIVGAHSSISMYKILDDGTLADLGELTFGPGMIEPKSLVKHPSANVLYVSYKHFDAVTGETSGRVGTLRIYPDGTLAQVDEDSTGSNFCDGISIHPTLPILYIACQSSAIRSFDIGADHALTLRAGEFRNISAIYPSMLAFDPSGRCIYASSSGSGSVEDPGKIYRFPVDAEGFIQAAEGAWMASISAGMNMGVTVHPSGNAVYAAAYCPNDPVDDNYRVYAFGADLTPLGSALTGQSNNVSVTITPDGNYAYVGTGASDRIVKFNLNADGSFAESGREDYHCLVAHASVLHPDGRFLYAITWDRLEGAVTAFSRTNEGTLTEIQRIPANWYTAGIVVVEIGG